MNKCVFLDRDGTINVDYGYTYLPEELELMSGVPQALYLLKKKGFLLIVITNQSGIAKGKFTVHDMKVFNDEINKQLMQRVHVIIDAFYFCPHHPSGIIEPYNRICRCRKPESKLLYQAAEDFDIDLGASYIVGDSDCDIVLGQRNGLKDAYRMVSDVSILEFVHKIN